MATLDPGKSADSFEGLVIRCLFEGLTNYHPRTLEPMAGLATHYDSSSDGLQLTFFLRGHSQPRGTALPNTDTLRDEHRNRTLGDDLSRGLSAPSDRIPAYWNDATPITAHDVVYSWRRVLDPATASYYAYLLYCIQNAQAVNAGRVTPQKLGVRALDEFALHVDLRAHTPFFLSLLSFHTFFPVPRQAIEAAVRRGEEDAWTHPDSIVTSGAFTLQERQSRDRILVARNPRYYEAGIVALEQVEFLLTQDTATNTNLYKSGLAHCMPGMGLPPLVLPALSGKRDFCKTPAFATFYPCFNTKQPPFDNVLVRYAFNMALDKKAIASVFGAGRVPARSLIPPLAGYKPPVSLPVRIEGANYDVLQYNPIGARELLAKAGFAGGLDSKGLPLTVDLLCPNYQNERLNCEILQQQWQTNLSIKVTVTSQEFSVFLQNIYARNYRGIAENADWGFYLDPNWFLDQFLSGSAANVTGWADGGYDTMLAKANATLDPLLRMERLADCERYLLRAMPFCPEYHDVWAYPQKPFVRGMAPNVMDVHPLKYAWVETNWTPQ